MDRIEEVFADAIGQIHFAGGMVRFDFVTFESTAQKKKTETQDRIRIIMPPQGFLNTFKAMQQLMDKVGNTKSGHEK